MRDFLFQHKGDTILNINDVVRREIRNVYERAILLSDNPNSVIEEFKLMLLEMHEEDVNSYNLYVQVMIADLYKMLIHAMQQNTITETQLMSYSILNNFDLNAETMVSYIDTTAGIFEEMIESSVAFENLNLLGRKTVVQNSREYDSKIFSVSPLYALDVYNYGEKTTVNEFLDYYVKTLDLIITEPDMLVSNILSHMKHLYLFNQENYLENVREMGKVFYKWRKFVTDRDFNNMDYKIPNYLEKFEENNIKDLGDMLLYDNDFFIQLIDDFCYFGTINQIKVRDQYFTEAMVDKFIGNKLPSSLTTSIQKIKK